MSLTWYMPNRIIGFPRHGVCPPIDFKSSTYIVIQMNKYLVALFKLTFENRIGFRFGKRQVGRRYGKPYILDVKDVF